jgi:hypothetical protein
MIEKSEVYQRLSGKPSWTLLLLADYRGERPCVLFLQINMFGEVGKVGGQGRLC